MTMCLICGSVSVPGCAPGCGECAACGAMPSRRLACAFSAPASITRAPRARQPAVREPLVCAAVAAARLLAVLRLRRVSQRPQPLLRDPRYTGRGWTAISREDRGRYRRSAGTARLAPG